MRAVIDTGVLVSSLISPDRSLARLLAGWYEGEFDVVASPLLLSELDRVLRYPKFDKRILVSHAEALLADLRAEATILDDPDTPSSVRCRDPDDDYLIALAESARAALVTGDGDLLALAERIPVFTAERFLTVLEDYAS